MTSEKFLGSGMKCDTSGPDYLKVGNNGPGIKYKIYGVMWQVAPGFKIQFFSCNLSPKSLLGLYALEDICDIDT